MLILLLFLTMSAAGTAAAQGSAIEATIHGTDQPLDVVLFVRDGDAWQQVDRKTLPAAAHFVRFSALKSGVYHVLVRGRSSTEQIATKVVIGDGNTRRAEVVIDPVIVTGQLPAASGGPGSISLRNQDFEWRGIISVQPDGTFRFPLWQHGTFTYAVRSAAMPNSYSGTIDLEGPSPIRFPIVFPEGRITGIVYDAKSGSPVRGASIALQTNASSEEHHGRAVTDVAGRFHFDRVRLGRQIIRVVSSRHLEANPVVFDLDPAHSQREVDVRLDPGRKTSVSVLDPDNHPVANATLLVVANAKRRSRATTDESGSAHVALPEDEMATLFVIPDERAFGVVQVDPAAKGIVTIHLLPASSSLRIRARTKDGKPMPRFSLLMRYDGVVVPVEVAEELSVVQRMQFVTDENSETDLLKIPPGKYEFWPYRSQEEVESILASSLDAAPPIRVDVHPGENSIVVTFAAR
jgi:hypothetical protein